MTAKLVPTDDERQLVQTMSGHGVPHQQIASLIQGGIDRDTLTKHFRSELDIGKAKANSQIGSTLFEKAKGGDTAALIFWAKTQMGWRDQNVGAGLAVPEGAGKIIIEIEDDRKDDK